MRNRTFFLILVFYVPTLLWGTVGVMWYFSLIAEKGAISLYSVLNNVFSVSDIFGIIVLISSYILAILLGLLSHSEKNLWERKNQVFYQEGAKK